VGQFKALCTELGLFCEEQRHQEHYWPGDTQCTLRDYGTGIGRCIFVSLFNNTPHTLKLSAPNPFTPEEPTHGKWYLYPRDTVPPGQTTQFMVPKHHYSLFGAEAKVAYDIEGTNVIVMIHAAVPFNLWWFEAAADARIRGGSTKDMAFELRTKPGSRAGKTDALILNAELCSPKELPVDPMPPT